jgi:anaerobic selenocysteine-containing dehydrogenase
MDVAQQHAHSLQPGVLRSTWQTVSGLGSDRMVGRKSETVGRTRFARCSGSDRWTGYFEWSTCLPLESRGRRPLFAAVYQDPDPKNPQLPRDVAYVPKDGPLPEMYEPVESPVENVLHPTVKHNPVLKYPRVKSHQPIGTVEEFPYVLMTSTVAEHWCGGSSTRNIRWLNELVPEPMLEVP